MVSGARCPNVVKWADHWNYAGFDLDGFVAKRAVLHELCEAAGRDPAEIMTSIHQPVASGRSRRPGSECRGSSKTRGSTC